MGVGVLLCRSKLKVYIIWMSAGAEDIFGGAALFYTNRISFPGDKLCEFLRGTTSVHADQLTGSCHVQSFLSAPQRIRNPPSTRHEQLKALSLGRIVGLPPPYSISADAAGHARRAKYGPNPLWLLRKDKKKHLRKFKSKLGVQSFKRWISPRHVFVIRFRSVGLAFTCCSSEVLCDVYSI